MTTNQVQEKSFEVSNEFLRYQKELCKDFSIPVSRINKLIELKNQRDLWNFRYETCEQIDSELSGQELQDNLGEGL